MFQIGLMLAVLPFVGIWSGLRRGYTAVRGMDVRRLGGFWRGQEEAKIEEIEEEVVENSISRMIQDDGIRIEVTTTTSPAPNPRAQTPTTPIPTTRRQSLLPSSAAITAYTLSSPQTLRRAVDQAREIYGDIEGKRREVGKKRGEGELVRGLMKKRVQEMEEKRGRGAAGTTKAVTAKATAKPSEVKVQDGKDKDGKIQEANAVAGPSTGTTRGSYANRPYKKRQTGPTTTEQSAGETVVPPTAVSTASQSIEAEILRRTAARGRGRGRGAGKQMAETGRRVGGRSANVSETQRTRLTGWTASTTLPASETRTESALDVAATSRPLPGSQPPTLEGQSPASEAASAPQSTAVEPQSSAKPLEQPSAPSRYVYPSMTSLLPQPHASIARDPQPSASSGSTFGLGFGDIGRTEETSIASTQDTRSQRSLFVPGGFPLVASPSSVRTHQRDGPVDQSLTPVASSLAERGPSVPGASGSQLVVAESSQALPPSNASKSNLNVPGSSQSAPLERPLLRKNNSLGLVGTLDSMRSPSLEPTSAFANPPAIRTKDPLASYSHATIQSRLRPQSIIDAELAADRIISQQSSLRRSLSDRQHPSSQGIYVPLMPLPLVTPASSPLIHQSASVPPTPDTGGPAVVTQAVVKETVIGKPQSQEKNVQVEKPRPEKPADVEKPRPEKPADSSDLSDLEDTPKPSAFATLPAVTTSTASEKPRTVTRIPFGRPGGPVRPTRAVRPSSKAASDVAERNRTTRATSDIKSGSQARRGQGASSTSRIAVGQDRTVRAKAVVADSDASRVASTSTARIPATSSVQTAGKTINDRKRKEPPQTEPVTVQRRETSTATLRSGKQRAVRPVLPAAVIAHREFALPEGIIADVVADVTSARRTRASLASSTAASRILGSPTKRRKTEGGPVATAPVLQSNEQSENENQQEQAISPWRSRRMRARPSSNDR